MNLDVLAQVGITLFGVGAVFLVGLKNPQRARYGYIAGLIAQPFWCYMLWHNEQWGILPLVLFYGYSWANGLRNHWRQP